MPLTSLATERRAREAAPHGFGPAARSLALDWHTSLAAAQAQRGSEALGQAAVEKGKQQILALQRGTGGAQGGDSGNGERGRKAYDKHRRQCRCDAYKFPASPPGRVVPVSRSRMPKPAKYRGWRSSKFKAQNGEPTAGQMAAPIALTTRPSRRYRRRYAGIRRQIAS